MRQDLNKEIFATIFNIYRMIRKKFDLLREKHLTMIQIYGLSFIKEKKNCQLKQLANAFSITLPTANSLVEKLVSLGLVSKTHDKKDQRVIRLKITAKGNDLIKKIAKEKEKCFADFINKLSNKEKEQLLVILKKIIS